MARPPAAPAFLRVLTALLALTLATRAVALTVFTPGTPARASAVNANFSELSERIDTLEPYAARVISLEDLPPRVDALEDLPARIDALSTTVSGLAPLHVAETLDVDCTADPLALRDALDEAAGPGDLLLIAGACTGPVTVTQRDLTLRAAPAGGTIELASTGIALDITAAGVRIDGLVLRTPAGSSASGIRATRGAAVTLSGIDVVDAQTDLLLTTGAVATLLGSPGIDSVTVTDGAELQVGEGNGGLAVTARRGAGVVVLPQPDTTDLAGVEISDGARFTARGAVAIAGRLIVIREAVAVFEAGIALAYRDPAAPNAPGILVARNASLTLVGGAVDAGVRVSAASDLAATGIDFSDSTDAHPGGLVHIDTASVFDMRGGSAGAITTAARSAAVLDGAVLAGAADGVAIEVSGGHVATRGQTTADGDALVEDNGSLSLEDTTLVGDLAAFQNSSIRIGDGVDVQATRAKNGSCPLSPTAGIRLDMGSMLVLDTAATTLSGFLRATRFSAVDPGVITRLPAVDAEPETVDMLPAVSALNLCSSG